LSVSRIMFWQGICSKKTLDIFSRIFDNIIIEGV